MEKQVYWYVLFVRTGAESAVIERLERALGQCAKLRVCVGTYNDFSTTR
jgi:hypothetical protein